MRNYDGGVKCVADKPPDSVRHDERCLKSIGTVWARRRVTKAQPIVHTALRVPGRESGNSSICAFASFLNCASSHLTVEIKSRVDMFLTVTKSLIPLLLICLFNQPTVPIRWLAIGHMKQFWNESHHCPKNGVERKKYGLIGAQTKLCKRHADLMPIIMRAAAQTATVCQNEFSDRRWNCSSIRLVPKLTPDLTKGRSSDDDSGHQELACRMISLGCQEAKANAQ
ncbi:unnamed protein product [Soboliphyme baturini]|uniref:Protein Wnt n=1 Tax=Soboliphyme baturini TaxID=241478 RepID=A0A183ICU5_9BILA|nr:unnamed protein product [Soboliphyme baturini]